MSYNNKKSDQDEKFNQKDSKTNKSGKKRNSYSGAKRKSNQGRSKFVEDEPKTSAEGANNPSWYIPDPVVMDQASRFSFSNFTGVAVDFNPTTPIAGLTGATLNPGAIMQIAMNPSPGYTGLTNANVAAVNQQAFRTYARLSSINAKNTNYTPNDVSTMILAMGELISMLAVAQRAYGLLWTYNVRNRSMPKMLVDLAGVDSTLLSSEAAEYLVRLNTLIVEANKIPFPSNIDYFSKCAEMYSSVYKDDESDMAGLYVPIPYTTWSMVEDVSVEGTVLRTTQLWDSVSGVFTPMTPSAMLDLVETMINNMLTSATYNYVYSDILNLATKDSSVNMLQFTPLTTDYTVMPIYEKEFLLRINNATIMGEPLQTKAEMYLPDLHTISNDVFPDIDTMCLNYAPQFMDITPVMGIQNIINFYTDEPTLEERIEATRYMNNAVVVRYGLLKSNESKDSGSVKAAITGNYYTDSVIAMGDHYVVEVNVYTTLASGADMSFMSSAHVTNGGGYTGQPSVLTRFSLHPYIYELTHTGETQETWEWSISGLIGDLDFYTTVGADTLNRINKLALYALYDVRDITKS